MANYHFNGLSCFVKYYKGKRKSLSLIKVDSGNVQLFSLKRGLRFQGYPCFPSETGKRLPDGLAVMLFSRVR